MSSIFILKVIFYDFPGISRFRGLNDNSFAGKIKVTMVMNHKTRMWKKIIRQYGVKNVID